jgi:hypothetical protein
MDASFCSGSGGMTHHLAETAKTLNINFPCETYFLNIFIFVFFVGFLPALSNKKKKDEEEEGREEDTGTQEQKGAFVTSRKPRRH